MKTKRMYNVRVYLDGSTMGRNLGFKGRLLPYQRAVKVVARMRKSGIQCVAHPMNINY